MSKRAVNLRADEVRAARDGTLTEIRRPVKQAVDKLDGDTADGDTAWAVCPAAESGWIAWFGLPMRDAEGLTKALYRRGFRCPLGAPGDVLWGREAYRLRPPWEERYCIALEVTGVRVERDDSGWVWVVDVKRSEENS